MSGFISELLVPEDNNSWLWPCCQHCQRLKDCPYVYDQLLCHAACQGHASAQLLTAEADRLLETISSARDIRQLLRGSMALEQALSHALHSELALIDRLCAQTAEHSL